MVGWVHAAQQNLQRNYKFEYKGKKRRNCLRESRDYDV